MITLLICEDENTFVLRFKLILQRVGISTQEFYHCYNAKEAITSFQKLSPDIVFLDINLKGSQKDGFEILTDLRNMLKNTCKIGIISTSSFEVEIEKAKQLSANFYIVKTGDLKVFSKRMENFKKMFIDNDEMKFIVFDERNDSS